MEKYAYAFFCVSKAVGNYFLPNVPDVFTVREGPSPTGSELWLEKTQTRSCAHSLFSIITC